MADTTLIQRLPLLCSPSAACKRKLSGLTIKTDFAVNSFPEYVDPFESSGDTMTDALSLPANKLVDKLRGTTEPARHPSPQPTHVSYPSGPRVNGNGHKVLRSATVGYVAPEFHGKPDQMKQGS